MSLFYLTGFFLSSPFCLFITRFSEAFKLIATYLMVYSGIHAYALCTRLVNTLIDLIWALCCTSWGIPFSLWWHDRNADMVSLWCLAGAEQLLSKVSLFLIFPFFILCFESDHFYWDIFACFLWHSRAVGFLSTIWYNWDKKEILGNLPSYCFISSKVRE